MIARAIAWLSYPLIVAASVAVAVVSIDRGVDPGLAATLPFLAALLLTAVLERAQPHVARWNPSLREAAPDGAYLLLAAVTQRVVSVLVHAAVALTTLVLARWLGPRPWSAASPWLLAPIALLASDLGKYLVHRRAHESPRWWRFHAAHHAQDRMYSLNGVRLHPVNIAWNLGLDLGASLLLGLDARTIVVLAAFRGAVGVLQHANVAMALGPLNWILSTPELHQWHHSVDLREANANYGSTLIVWDVVFGTRIHPRERTAPAAVGLAEGSVHPRGVLHELVWPWCAPRAATCALLTARRPRSPPAPSR